MTKERVLLYTRFLNAALVGAALTVGLSGCNIFRYGWQYYDETVDTTLREPTGYYEHAEAKEIEDKLVVPEGLEEPLTDDNMKIPEIYGSNTLIGEGSDVRPPIVPLRLDVGINGQYSENEAIIWFDKNGSHGINTEEDAFALLKRMLEGINVEIESISQDSYELTTKISDYNEFGRRYGGESDTLRYVQIYRLRVGRSQNGNLGIATALVASKTLLPGQFFLGTKTLTDTLTPVELQRFAMGFSNQIINELEAQTTAQHQMPSEVVMTLGRDNNNRQTFLVNAPYDATISVLRSMMPKYAILIKEYSISHSSFTVEVTEEDPQFYASRGVDAFHLPEEEYIIRVGVHGGQTSITFFDIDDMPLPENVVNRLYSGFSQAMGKEYLLFSQQGLSYGVRPEPPK